jgi:transposase
MYERRSRLPSYQQGELLKMFVVGATARAAAEVVGLHRNTAAGFFMPLRKLIASTLPSYELSGEVEAD